MKINKIIYRNLIITIIICLLYITPCLLLGIDYQIEFILLMLIINYMSIKLYSKHHIEDSYKQLETLIPLIVDLNIKKRLPGTRDYAGSPDYLFEIKNIIKEKKPNLILEAGSGVSTLISAYTLKKYGGGRIISLDHDQKYAQQTQNELKAHGLEDYAEVIYAPLKNYGDLEWYDYSLIKEGELIDLFTIDGPPEKRGKTVRYPAIPLMFNKLNKDAIIILDDARRKNEQKTLQLWKAEYDCFEYTYIDNDKGLSIIKKIK